MKGGLELELIVHRISQAAPSWVKHCLAGTMTFFCLGVGRNALHALT